MKVVAGLGRERKVHPFADIAAQGGVEGRADVVGVVQIIIDEARNPLKGASNTKVEVRLDDRKRKAIGRKSPGIPVAIQVDGLTKLCALLQKNSWSVHQITVGDESAVADVVLRVLRGKQHVKHRSLVGIGFGIAGKYPVRIVLSEVRITCR